MNTMNLVSHLWSVQWKCGWLLSNVPSSSLYIYTKYFHQQNLCRSSRSRPYTAITCQIVADWGHNEFQLNAVHVLTVLSIRESGRNWRTLLRRFSICVCGTGCSEGGHISGHFHCQAGSIFGARCCYPFSIEGQKHSPFSGMCRLKDRLFYFNIPDSAFPTIAQSISAYQWSPDGFTKAMAVVVPWAPGNAGFVRSFGSITRSFKGNVKQCETWNSLGRVVRDGDCTCCSLRCVIRFWKVADELVQSCLQRFPWLEFISCLTNVLLNAISCKCVNSIPCAAPQCIQLGYNHHK